MMSLDLCSFCGESIFLFAFVLVLVEEKDVVSTMLQFDSARVMWKNFISATGLPGQGSNGLSPVSRQFYQQ